MYTSMYKSCIIYASMDLTTEMIAVVMGRGRDDKCEVVDQDCIADQLSVERYRLVHEVMW